MSSRKLTSVYKLKQALRRSIKGEKESKPHITIAPKSAVAIVPPKKVRRYLSSEPPYLSRC
jgi:bud emergence protein 1